MNRTLLWILFCLISTIGSSAQAAANFAGKWVFDSAHSKNVAMMAQATIRTTIRQSKLQVVVDDASTFNGQSDIQHTVYDLSSKPVQNKSAMAGSAASRSRWEGSRLITGWESAGAIAGTTVKRTETRFLSPDGETMYVESGKAGKDSMVIVFKKDR
jgi:hypothetical protein